MGFGWSQAFRRSVWQVDWGEGMASGVDLTPALVRLLNLDW